MLRGYGFWTDKTKDRYWDPRAKRWVYPETGVPDMKISVPSTTPSVWPMAYIEAKTGTTNLPFKNWKPEQRDWYYKFADRGLLYWLHITMGHRIGGKKYPRRAILVPAEMFLSWEIESPRLSLSYDQATNSKYCLEWIPGHGFSIPTGHLFYSTFCSPSQGGLQNAS